MRRTYLCQNDNIAKRLLVHVAGPNVALLMQARFGVGKPGCLQGCAAAFLAAITPLLRSLGHFGADVPRHSPVAPRPSRWKREIEETSTTGCLADVDQSHNPVAIVKQACLVSVARLLRRDLGFRD